MGKSVYIAEKPSVAQEFAKALKLNTRRKDGYLESDEAIVTWCVGHLVTMSYPEEYDPALKRWSLNTLPFIPKEFKYEVIPSVAKQFQIVSGLLTRADVDTIYVCTDSGREGEYIYRVVEQEAHVEGKKRISDGDQFFPSPDAEIWEQHIQLSAQQVCGHIGRARNDLRAGDGCPQRAGDQGLC